MPPDIGNIPTVTIFVRSTGIKFLLMSVRILIACMAMSTGISLFAGEEQSATPENPDTGSMSTRIADSKRLLSDKGVTLQFSYIGESLANVSGGYRQGAVYKGAVNIGISFDLDKLTGWKGGTFFASSMFTHGGSLTNEYVHNFNDVSSIDTYDSLRLYELWFQQKFAGDKASLRIGLLAADSEFFVSDYSGVFINSAFGTTPVVASQNFNAPFVPLTPPGIRLRVDATPSLSFLAGVYSGDTGQPNGNNQHGTRISFDGNDGALFLYEADYRVNQQEKSEGLTGTYKLCGFYQTSFFPDNDGRGNEHGDYGFCVIVDQQLWQPDKTDRTKGIGVFSHIGAAPADRNPVSFYLDAGVNCKGLIPSREKDTFGLAMNWTRLSNQLRDGSGAPVQTHHETTIEATYQAVINDWLSFQPDFQYIINPGGTTPARNATVLGARFTVTF